MSIGDAVIERPTPARTAGPMGPAKPVKRTYDVTVGEAVVEPKDSLRDAERRRYGAGGYQYRRRR